ncbi:hypothetical protein BB561_004872 [Smittium simulii]|uniref:Reverse transcriptase zinc-binding domain-containing protein n=1 Tax=Smittium simulii TaxID=133385 RepID=A0A2T9YDP3_9FUNG|nr:hypothetical protein BB561_004872 [Smittium simulii]
MNKDDKNIPYIEEKINRSAIGTKNTDFPTNRLTIAGLPIADFNPKSARQYILGNLTKINVNINYWNIDNKTKTKIPTWQEISNTKIIPKIKSLIWTIYHNAANSDKKLSLFSKENSPKCKYCGEDNEDIKHKFFKCSRIQIFWGKINEFLNNITLENNTQTQKLITKYDVVDRLNKFKSQIHHGHQMFSRWKINLKNQIIMDWSTSKISAIQWTKTKTKWFYIEPDGYNKENIVFK